MKIVIIDPIHLEDAHRTRLQAIGEVTVHNDIPTGKETLRRVKDADIVMMASTDLDGPLLEQCPQLKLIALGCTGFNRVDIACADRQGITVTNVPAYSTDSVAEHIFALLFTLYRKIREADRHVHEGGYDWTQFSLTQLAGKTFGIIGYGTIGSRVARIAAGFGCRVLVNTQRPSAERERPYLKFVSLKKLLAESDVISLHVPLNDKTNNLINEEAVGLMEKKPVLINTARGPVIQYEALLKGLKSGQIGGAGLDVFPYEPPRKDDPLLKIPNLVVTPHIAFHTPDALRNCADIAVGNIEAFLKGRAMNVVNRPRKDKVDVC